MNKPPATAQDLHTVFAIHSSEATAAVIVFRTTLRQANERESPTILCAGRNQVSYIPFEARVISLNMLKNNGLIRRASGRLSEIYLRAGQEDMPVSLKKKSFAAVAGRMYFPGSEECVT
jgi:hypothetical protein